MIVYWKSATNQVLELSHYEQVLNQTEKVIRQWGKAELYLEADFLDQFVTEKMEEFSHSYLKVNLPFITMEECREHIETFYEQYSVIINSFPYDRWVWVKKLETLHYHDVDYVSVHVESKIVDVKEPTASAYSYTN